MKIAVLSGKGGTGKTFVSVNLAAAANSACYIDCDVEEPNGHLFLKPANISEEKVCVKVPEINNKACVGCRKCVNFCAFNALAYIKEKVLVFDILCHSCGGCVMLCPEKAITEKDRETGKIEQGKSKEVNVFTGYLNIGEASGVPIIKQLMDKLKNYNLSVIDCPPGSSCQVMESIKIADYCLMVVEPTIFGMHNFKMVLELVRLFKKPYGVVINKCLSADNIATEFCKSNNIKILEEVPYSEYLAKINSEGKIAVREDINYKTVFKNMLIEIGEVI
jgi:MinD superfamily P-loop ATPase